MNLLTIELLCIASLTALTCVIPGTLLVLRGASLMSDAISHAVLLGIAIMFLFVQQLDSWLLFFGATLSGLAAVIVVEKIISSHSLKKDAALGLTFPLFLSLGIIIISMYAKNAHLDTDMVLLGELAFAPFNRLYIGSYDIGPCALWTLLATSGINALLIWIFYKEWPLILFDHQLAHSLGFTPTTLHYLLMALTSMSAVASFNIVGSLVVVALMIIPAATAYLCAQTFFQMIGYALGFGLASAWGGCALATVLNTSIAGSIAVIAGILFAIVLCFAPKNGVYARIKNLHAIRKQHAQNLVEALLNQQKGASYTAQQIAHRLGWSLRYTKRVIARLAVSPKSDF